MIKKIIIDARGSRLFRGSEVEQDHDQRGVFCHGNDTDLAITTNPVDPDYITYWKKLGFGIPRLLIAGPYNPRYTLSELIFQRTDIMDEIRAFAAQDSVRIEFSMIEDTESRLAKALGIPAYCNFDISIGLSRKIPFKNLCKTLGLPTAPWIYDSNPQRMIGQARKQISAGVPLLFKLDDGTGGIPCGSMLKADNMKTFEETAERVISSGLTYFAEEFIHDKTADVDILWEITENREIIVQAVGDLISRNCSYDGVCCPAMTISSETRDMIMYQLKNILGPWLIRHQAKGFFVCDIVVDRHGVPLWTDFNPRKGGTLYIWEMVRRLSAIHFNSAECCFCYEHIPGNPLNPWQSFAEVKQVLSDFLHPGKKPFIVITNPGIIRFGDVDITGISTGSNQEAVEFVQQAKARLRERFS